MYRNRKIKRELLKTFLLGVFILSGLSPVFSQKTADVYVDDKGVMRWGNTKEEVKGFGVNYTVPFAHAYRMAERNGISHEKAIEEDVYHFARLGLDLYRVHVWDTEISDSAGNLIENEHLRLFDFAVKKMKERGMKFFLTPIAYWGNGWPEPNEPTPGFSEKYGKEGALTHPEAIKAQENYLFQFLNHVNPYTGLAYKDDPDVIAFEVSNEPKHLGTAAETTDFINKMARAMRKTGTKKPIFYNMSHMTHLAPAYLDAEVQGGTFQWYPTNLLAGHELGGNFLPNVDKYTIPFADSSRFKRMAKIVYEFDPADIGASYMYPAMARSFREANLQLAAQFAYDATYMASYNTEYGTHYMNLPYAPQKALSLKIASEVFHEIPMGKSYGSYPANKTFGDFRVDYEQDLAEMVSEKKFFYTNHTKSNPPSIKKLEQIAGYGNSPVVSYEGTGAYFLDRLEKGVWRLEVMPDAMWIDDPFSKTSPKKTVAVVNWQEQPMSIHLPGLGNDFTIEPLNEGNTHSTKAAEGAFKIQPGAYLLRKKGTSTKLNGESQWKNIRLKEFVAPPTSLDKTYVLHNSAEEVSAGQPVTISAEIIGVKADEKVELHVNGVAGSKVLEMERAGAYTYTATIPAELIRKGFLRYYIVLKEEGAFKTYPSGLQTHPRDWDFYVEKPFELRVVDKDAPVYLFNATTDSDELMREWAKGSGLMPAEVPGERVFVLNLEGIPAVSPESNSGKKEHDYSMRYYFGDKVAGRSEDITAKSKLVFHGQSLNGKKLPLQLALLTTDGAAYGGVVTISPEEGDYAISLDELKKVKQVNLPRAYPEFMPYYFENKSATGLELKDIESLQFSVGPGISDSALDEHYKIAIENVRLE